MQTAHERLIDHLRNAEVLAQDLGLPEVEAGARLARKQALADLEAKRPQVPTKPRWMSALQAAVHASRDRPIQHLPECPFGSIKDSSR